jgi:hypothetical protein
MFGLRQAAREEHQSLQARVQAVLSEALGEEPRVSGELSGVAPGPDVSAATYARIQLATLCLLALAISASAEGAWVL